MGLEVRAGVDGGNQMIRTDRELLDWLQEQVVDTIYLDDGRIIDVRGGSVREAIEKRAARDLEQGTGPL